MNETYDVFVSYRQRDPDRSWVRTVLVPALDAAGLRVFVDYRCFILGRTVIENMATAVESSRFTLAVMTPEYFTSGFTTLERIIAQHLGITAQNRRLIGLMLVECQLPVELQPYLWLDVSAVERPDAPELDGLCATIRQE